MPLAGSSATACSAGPCTLWNVLMKRLFDMEDRTRLRERFFGATRSVRARLR